uniref:Uncharacterized protein n=1 Tax=Verrucosispora sp. MS100047 TaxID=1410949 RepID=A0A097CT45_9ACTN|nr:hypothetical protein VASRM7_567 [Verrucosispora sp. MS100047]
MTGLLRRVRSHHDLARHAARSGTSLIMLAPPGPSRRYPTGSLAAAITGAGSGSRLRSGQFGHSGGRSGYSEGGMASTPSGQNCFPQSTT